MIMAGSVSIGLMPVPAQLLIKLTKEITARASKFSLRVSFVSVMFSSTVFSILELILFHLFCNKIGRIFTG